MTIAEASDRPDVYLSTAEKNLEKVNLNDSQRMWEEVLSSLRNSDLFATHSSEGLSVVQAEDSKITTPLPVETISRERIDRALDKKTETISSVNESVAKKVALRGFYLDGKIHLIENPDEIPMSKDNLANLAAGKGIGSRAKFIAHETYHGFQDSGKEEELSDEKLTDRKILKEMHAHLFSDPSEYTLSGIKTREDLSKKYSEFVLKKYREVLGEYDYMQGRVDEKMSQAYMGFLQIEALRALGINNREIGQTIGQDSYDYENKRYRQLQERIFEERKKRGISRDQHLAIIDRYRLETVEKALQARNLCQNVLRKNGVNLEFIKAH